MSDETKQSTRTRGKIEESLSTKPTVRRPYRTVPREVQEKRAERFGERLEQDLLASLAGSHLNVACGGTKEISRLGEVVEANGRRWASGEPQNPVNRVRRIMEKSKQPFHLCGYYLACAVRGLLLSDPMPEWRWRSLYLQAMRDEAHPDGAEDTASVELLTGKGSLRSQYDADAAAVSALLRRMALGMIGILRGWSLQGPRVN